MRRERRVVPGPIHRTAEVVDFVSGETRFVLKAPAGANLGAHHHYGYLLVYSVQGRVTTRSTIEVPEAGTSSTRSPTRAEYGLEPVDLTEFARR